MPCVTENTYGKGKAYYAAFRNDNDFADDFCEMLIKANTVESDADIAHGNGVFIRKRGQNIYIMNFSDSENSLLLYYKLFLIKFHPIITFNVYFVNINFFIFHLSSSVSPEKSRAIYKIPPD